MATTKVAMQESSPSNAEICRCGEPGCLGHEVIEDMIQFPGFTSERVMHNSPHELLAFNVPVTAAFWERGESPRPE